jgi:hypothetical protein
VLELTGHDESGFIYRLRQSRPAWFQQGIIRFVTNIAFCRKNVIF